MIELANVGYITATDLADYLVKNHSMTFRNAYKKTALIVNFADNKKKKLSELSIDDLKKILLHLKEHFMAELLPLFPHKKIKNFLKDLSLCYQVLYKYHLMTMRL